VFANSLKIACRNIKNYKSYTWLTIIGLAVGLASCIIIGLYVRFELSYDAYHQNAASLYRVIEFSTGEGKQEYSTSTPAPLAPLLAEEFPEIRQAIRFFHPSWDVKWKVSSGEKTFYEESVYFADPSALEAFSFPLLVGNRKEALKDPNSMVITPRMARKYFGTDNATGQTLLLNNAETKITGMLDEIPPNSHFRFDFLVSFATLRHPAFKNIVYDMLDDWRSHNLYTYLWVRKDAAPSELEKKIIPLLEKHLQIKVTDTSLCLQPLRDIHLHSKNFVYEIAQNNSDIIYVYIFSAVALLILAIASINSMNLTTARAAARSKEVSLRKINGASRWALILQFLTESAVASLIALGLAFVIVSLCLPALNSFIGSRYVFGPGELIIILGLILAGSLLLSATAGLYPALFLSTFHPLNVLRGYVAGRIKKAHFRRALIVFQFTISIALIVGTLCVRAQLKYCLNKYPGFEKDSVIGIPVRETKTMANFESLKNRLLQYPEIKKVARCSALPGKTLGRGGFLPEGGIWSPRYFLWVDEDFIPALGMQMAEGRNFSRALSTDVGDSYIINEAACREFGWEKAVGKRLIWRGDRNGKGEVIGVVRDFHFTSLRQKIEPLVMMMTFGGFSHLAVRFSSRDMLGTIEKLGDVWKEFQPDLPFEFFFLDDQMDSLYQAEKRMARISGIFTLLAIFVACLGLFGLAANISERRTKEIGIRKVLGASSSGVAVLLCREFAILVALANVVAWPSAYFAISRWLQGFAYRISIGIGAFILSGLLALAIALATVSYQAVKTARANPVEALRYE
jgi:putative ABC transport system permease protein